MSEKPPIYEHFDPGTTRYTRIDPDPDYGLLIESTQDIAPIIESSKALASSFDAHAARKLPFVHVARIPSVIYRRLQMLGITRDEAAFNHWLDQPENKVFRCDDGRKL